jgi:hypothetical protein
MYPNISIYINPILATLYIKVKKYNSAIVEYVAEPRNLGTVHALVTASTMDAPCDHRRCDDGRRCPVHVDRR